MKKRMPIPRVHFCILLLSIILSLLPQSSMAGEKPLYGGVLKISLSRNLRGVGYPGTTRVDEMLIASPCVETFLRLDDQGVPGPNLIKTWEVKDNGKSLIVHLEKGVKFHDGTDFNAGAMKYIIDIILPETKQVDLKAYSIKSVDVIDTYTARFNLEKWNNKLLVAMCTNKGNAISPAAHKKHGMKWLRQHPVGTGPFKFVKWEKDVVIRYERFDDYWRGKPFLDAVEYHIIADPLTQLASFLSGEHHIAGDLSPKDAKYIEEKGKHIIQTVPGQYHCLHGDGGNEDSVWSNLKVRQAMAHAINSNEIADSIGLGYWRVALKGSLAIKDSWLADASIKGYPYDPEKAKKLLAEAGYPNGFDTTLLVKNTPQHLVDAMTAIQGQLRKVGIRVKLDLMDIGREHEITIGGGWHNGLHHVPHTRRPEYAIMESYARIGYHFSPSILRPEETWKMLQKALQEPDQEKCKRIMHEVYKLDTDKYASNHWLFAMSYIAAKSKKVHDDGFMKASNMWWPSWKAWLSK